MLRQVLSDLESLAERFLRSRHIAYIDVSRTAHHISEIELRNEQIASGLQALRISSQELQTKLLCVAQVFDCFRNGSGLDKSLSDPHVNDTQSPPCITGAWFQTAE